MRVTSLMGDSLTKGIDCSNAQYNQQSVGNLLPPSL
jgi:hypothetical protein